MNDLSLMKLANSIKNIAKGENKSFNNMIIGTVKTTDPLSIDIGNNIIIDEKFLFLGQMCRPHKVTIPHTHLVNALETKHSMAIVTTGISAGTSTDTTQSDTYDVKTQTVERDDTKGTDKRTLNTKSKSIDLGGAKLKMSINVNGSVVPNGAVTETTDLSTFTVSDEKHKHVVPEHTTQDVHFPGTDYEESVTIEIYPRLKADDRVIMFAFNNFQMFYVAERLELD